MSRRRRRSINLQQLQAADTLASRVAVATTLHQRTLPEIQRDLRGVFLIVLFLMLTLFGTKYADQRFHFLDRFAGQVYQFLNF